MGLFRLFVFRYKKRRYKNIQNINSQNNRLCYSENRIADVTKIDVMRPRKSGYAIFRPRDGRKLPKEHDYRLFCLFRTNRYSINSAIESRIGGILFRSFRNQNTVGPKRTQLPPIPCILIPVPKERALILDCAFVVEAAFNIGKCVHLSCFLFAQNHSLIKPRPNLGTSPIS